MNNKKQIANSLDLDLNLDQETISKVIHRIGHDVGNPLTSIISLSSIIEKFSDPKFNALDPQKLAGYANTISNEAWKISRLSECLVQTFSTRQITLQPIILYDALDRALAKVESQFTNHPNIEIEVNLDESIQVLADNDQLCFAITEIVRNAFQANIENEFNLVTINAELTENYCKLRCTNQLKAEITDDLKELFLPLKANSKKISTPGLGLFAIACVMNRLQGYCELEASNEFTTSIYLKWPS